MEVCRAVERGTKEAIVVVKAEDAVESNWAAASGDGGGRVLREGRASERANKQ